MRIIILQSIVVAHISSLIKLDRPHEVQSTFQTSNVSLGEDFMYGFASSSFQVEGAVIEDGKSLSIWDKFASVPSKVNYQSPNVTVDEYHLFNETVNLLKLAGANTYRMSISWTRIIPGGFAGTPVNKRGIDHYNRLFDLLIKNGINPMVTLYHWDLPQILEDEYKGFIDQQRFTRDFLYYAETAFSNFKQIKFWLTFNEPITYCVLGYATGMHAPGRCLNPFTCKFGLAFLDLFKCGHTTLVAHGHTVDLYRKKYGFGKISMANNIEWSEPITNSTADSIAAQNKLDFFYGWFMDPIHTGKYPQSIIDTCAWFLPIFTDHEINMIKGSVDFVAVNHYTTTFTSARSTKVGYPEANGGVAMVPWKAYFCDINGKAIGVRAESSWLYTVPWGFQKALEYIDKKYGAPDIYVTENGFSGWGEKDKSREWAMHDIDRISYHEQYLDAMGKAIQNGVKVKAYIAWTLMDNFEWHRGYDDRFGVVYVDRSNQYRYPKDSLYFLRDYFNKTIQRKIGNLANRY